MPSGGARANSGPPADPDALRRDQATAGWWKLPAGGRAGDPPEWPLHQQQPFEAEMWTREWRRPQAIMWERNGQEHEVALYVRRYLEAAEPDAPAALTNAVQRMQTSLGITVPGLRFNRWLIVVAAVATDSDGPEPTAAKPPARRGSRTTTGSTRQRLSVIRGDRPAS